MAKGAAKLADRLLSYDEEAPEIRGRLNEGALLVFSLCSESCQACAEWWGVLAAAAKRRPEFCFVWCDPAEHPDVVAEMSGLGRYPTVLIQSLQGVHFQGFLAKAEVLHKLLEDLPAVLPVPDPHVRDFLMEP